MTCRLSSLPVVRPASSSHLGALLARNPIFCAASLRALRRILIEAKTSLRVRVNGLWAGRGRSRRELRAVLEDAWRKRRVTWTSAIEGILKADCLSGLGKSR